MKLIIFAAILAVSCANAAQAQNHHHPASLNISGGGHGGHHHDGPSAPIGVMGDHMHDKGEWMLSYRTMRMRMEENRNGTNDLTPEEVITFSNPNAPPPNLRVVPTEMTMQMHMFGAMYGVTDWLTVMAMANYTKKKMDHITFQGATGTTRLGTFTTRSTGWGDSSVTGLFRIIDEGGHHLHAHAGLSIPTGSIKEEDNPLAPTGAEPRLRLPYAMQLGSGTYDALPGLTYSYNNHDWALGAQYRGVIRLQSDNSQGYSWGDQQRLSIWASHQTLPWLSTSFRMSGEYLGRIDGADSQIAAPIQTADPDNYGGRWLEASAGFNMQPEWAHGHEFGFEGTVPLYQNLNGPQLKRDYALTAGWAYKF